MREERRDEREKRERESERVREKLMLVECMCVRYTARATDTNLLQGLIQEEHLIQIFERTLQLLTMHVGDGALLKEDSIRGICLDRRCVRVHSIEVSTVFHSLITDFLCV
jgi:hypothetical protein